MKNYVIVIDKDAAGLFTLEAWEKWSDSNDGAMHRRWHDSYLTHKAAINEYERLLKASEGDDIRPVLIDRCQYMKNYVVVVTYGGASNFLIEVWSSSLKQDMKLEQSSYCLTYKEAIFVGNQRVKQYNAYLIDREGMLQFESGSS